MPTAGPFKGILAKGTGDLVDPATGFANAFVADIFLVFGLAKSRRKLTGMRDGRPHRCDRYEILISSAWDFSWSRKVVNYDF